MNLSAEQCKGSSPCLPTPGRTAPPILQQVTALHPDWTSMVLVIGRDG